MVALQWLWGPLLIVAPACALRFDPFQTAYNVNSNETANDPLDYWGEWQNHRFTPSPSNWRIPFYTVLLDRFVNGNPHNDDANGTQFEHDVSQTQLRHGGDIKGLQDSLDYLQGMGIKVGLTLHLCVYTYQTQSKISNTVHSRFQYTIPLGADGVYGLQYLGGIPCR